MKILLYILSLLLLIGGFFLSCFAIINTYVSIKYEADDGCISATNGDNLCNILLFWKISAIITFLLISGMIYYGTKILNGKNEVK